MPSEQQEKFRKMAKRLILDPDGRDALKEFGIEIELAGNGHKAEDKPIVAILCPTYRSPHPQMRDALSQMVQHTREAGITVYSGPPVQSSVVHWSRNWLVGEQLKSGKPWTHILFIDDDILVKPDHLTRLLAHKKDIIAGLCTVRKDPAIPNIKHFDHETREHGLIWEWPENSVFQVGGVGTGLMLVSMHALEQVAQAYFDCLWEKEFYGISDERVKELKVVRMKAFEESKVCYWFRFLPSFCEAVEYGEDMGFCMIASRYCDIPVFVDSAVQPGHLGDYPYTISDYLPYRDACIERAKEEGTYKVMKKIEPELQLITP